MYGPERIWSLLDLKADRIDDRKRISDSIGDRFLVINISANYFHWAAGVVHDRIASVGTTCGYPHREIPIKQVVHDATPEKSGSTEDRDRSTFAQRMHQQSLTSGRFYYGQT